MTTYDEHTSTRKPAFTCLIADDHPAVTETVRARLEQRNASVIACASDGREALEASVRTRPDVALLDLRMPQIDGIEVIRQARRLTPETHFVLYTAYAERSLLNDALDAGARGFVVKDAPLNDLARAIEAVAQGAVYIDPVLAGRFVQQQAHERLNGGLLTPRERDVLRLLSEGLDRSEVAVQLFIARETVQANLRRIYEKLGAKNALHAVSLALRNDMIS